MSNAFQAYVEEAKSYVREQPRVDMVETGGHEMGKQAWLWVEATTLVTVFALLATRSAAGVKRLLVKISWVSWVRIVGQTTRASTLCAAKAVGHI